MNRSPNASRAGGQSQTFIFGVEYERSDGSTFIAGGYTEAGARLSVARCCGKGWSPVAVRVMRAEPYVWQEAPAVTR